MRLEGCETRLRGRLTTMELEGRRLQEEGVRRKKGGK